jgi:Secretion system C-terminal sorting domain
MIRKHLCHNFLTLYTMTAKTFTIILLLSCIIAPEVNAQSIPNGDFENWTSSGGGDVLTGWQISEPALNCTPLSAAQTTSSQNASYAIFLEAGNCAGAGGNIHEGYAISDLFTVSAAPMYLHGYYKATRANSNPAKIKVFLNKNGVQIASADWPITTSQNEYIAFAIPITYVQNEVPDQAQIQIFSDEIGLSTLGNQLWVDHLSFSSSATVIADNDNVSTNISVYPNPACNMIQVNGNSDLIGMNYILTDISGRQVLSGQLHNENNMIALGELCGGIYFLRCDASSVKVFRLVKE